MITIRTQEIFGFRREMFYLHLGGEQYVSLNDTRDELSIGAIGSHPLSKREVERLKAAIDAAYEMMNDGDESY